MPRTVAVPESKSLDDLERDYELLCEELADIRATHRNLRLKRLELYRSKATKPADLEDVGAALVDLEARIEGLESAVEDIVPEVVAARALRDRRNSVAGEIAQAEKELATCVLVMKLVDRMAEVRGVFDEIGELRGWSECTMYFSVFAGRSGVGQLYRLALDKWSTDPRRGGHLVQELAGNLNRARLQLTSLGDEAVRLGVTVAASR